MPIPSRTATRALRRGFTYIEMMISITMLIVVLSTIIIVLQRQTQAIDRMSGRYTAQQNVQFASEFIARELRLAGAGVLDPQPLLVQADTMALTFNADIVTETGADIAAVYYDPDADPAAVRGFLPANKRALPYSNFWYPDSLYAVSGVPTNAETISYWAEPDTSTGAIANTYALYRQDNATTPRLLAQGLLPKAGQPMFRYFRRDSTGTMIEIPTTTLPLYHRTALHGAAADTGARALIDSVLLVRLHLNGIYRDPRTNAVSTRSVDKIITLANGGLIRRSTCGDVPIFGRSINVSADSVSNTVTLNWNPAKDETGGEKDVERYTIYKRIVGASGGFAEPMASIAAGLSSYSFTDTDVQHGTSYVYGISAQDCTPSSSPITSSSTVVMP